MNSEVRDVCNNDNPCDSAMWCPTCRLCYSCTDTHRWNEKEELVCEAKE